METPIVCEHCNKTYKTNITFQNHIKLKRCKIPDKCVTCTKCNKEFFNRDSRKRHEKICMVVKTPTNDEIEIQKLRAIILQLSSQVTRLITYVEKNKIN